MATTSPPPCKSPCPSPPCACVDAVAYADWKATASAADKDKLFAGLPDDASSYTRVVNYAAGNKARYAYGARLAGTRADTTPILGGVYYFHISFSDDAQGTNDIEEFGCTHGAWAMTRAHGTHEFAVDLLAVDDTPPKCGTPYTPTCPPDPLVQGTARYLRDLRAGPGANAAELALAAAEVDDFLLATITSALAARGVTAAVPTGLREAMAYLRNVTYQQALDAGLLPGDATLERVGLEVEGVLLAALEAEVQRLPKS